jgi:hypothetical protein
LRPDLKARFRLLLRVALLGSALTMQPVPQDANELVKIPRIPSKAPSGSLGEQATATSVVVLVNRDQVSSEPLGALESIHSFS